MIGKTNRFHGYNSLKPVYRKGQTARGPLLAIRYLPTSRDHYRAAVVVSRKVHKSAVTRNRIRRRVYEVIRLSAPRFTGSYDIVVTVFSERVAELKFEELAKTVNKILLRAGILVD